MDGNTAQQLLPSRHMHCRASVPATGSRFLAGLPDVGLGQPPSPAQNRDLTGSAASVTDFLRGSAPASTRSGPASSLTPIGLVCRPNLGARLRQCGIRPGHARARPAGGQPKRERQARCLDRASPGTGPNASQQVTDERASDKRMITRLSAWSFGELAVVGRLRVEGRRAV
jgi:hypothetical protein